MVKILTDKERIFKCPEPICRSLIVTPLRGYDHEVIKCPTCGTRFCFHCNFFYRDLDASPIWLYFEENYAIENYGMVHSMEVCIREYEFSKAPDKHARDAIMKLVKGRECPVCKYVVVKQSGCDHINCTQCDAHFCWRCGYVGKEIDERTQSGDIYHHMLNDCKVSLGHYS